jgi:hypothetical protein
MMRRLMTILATAMLALGMLTAVAEARGGDRMGGLGDGQIEFGGHPSLHGSGLHHHPHCYVPDEFPKYPPWPPFCS